MLREVYRFELAYRLRSGSNWIYAAVLFAFPIWSVLATFEPGVVHVNAPEPLAEAMTIVAMFGMLVSAALFGDAALRDVESGMDGLLYTSPLGKTDYLLGRFLAALTVNAIILLAIPLGLLATVMLPFIDASSRGPFRLAAYVQPFLLFLLPNLVVVGTVLFTIAMLTRKSIPVYLGAIGLFIGYIVASNFAQFDDPTLNALADTFGTGLFADLTRLWTPAERNTRLIGFPALLVWNRVLWLAVAAALLALLHRRFRFAHAKIDGGRRPDDEAADAVPAPARTATAPTSVPRLAGVFGVRTLLAQTLGAARLSFEEIVRGRAFPGVLAAAFGFAVLTGWDVGGSVFDTSTWPVTSLVVEKVLGQRIGVILVLLIALYTGEMVWKERSVGVSDIADASPMSDGAALAGRFLAVVALIALFQGVFMLAGVTLQALQGYYEFELGLYARMLFGLNLVHYILIAMLAMLIHVVVNQKYVGHLVVLLAFLFTMLAPSFGMRHHLLLYGTDPGWTYSDLNGFGPFMRGWMWFKLYWAAWALLLAVLANLLWVRGRELGPRRRLSAARARFTGPVMRTASAAVALVLVVGGFVFYNTNVLNAYTTAGDAGRTQAEYERRYKRFQRAPQPTVTSAELRVEVFPEVASMEVRGTFRLANRTGVPIDSVHVTFMDPDVEARVSFDRASKRVLLDDETSYQIHRLERPLAPGDSVGLVFDLSVRPRGFTNSGSGTDVVANGTYANDWSWRPIVGYQPALELSDDEARRRFGLPPQPPAKRSEDALQYREALRDADLVHVSAIIGTSANQTAITPGVLQRTWTENGRRYFHYVTETPAPLAATVFSGRYATVQDRWNDVALRIDHHPPHRDNVDRAMRGMKASLDYYTREFGPYRAGVLRIVEVPRYSIFGRAHPGAIAFSEDYFITRVREGEIDQAFYGAAHEVAHQWWGGQVRAATGVPGAGYLSESLANYSAMMVTEKTFGVEEGRRTYGFQMERYLAGHAEQSREVPLLEAGDQPYIMYRKGAIALHTLRDHIGEAGVNLALRRYLEKYRDAGPPYPTALDLHAELRAVTPDSLRYLLTDWFETVTLWEVRTDTSRVERLPSGEYRVTLEVSARKTRADSVGNETETPMNDLVQIGVFAASEGDGESEVLGAPLYLERHWIRSGKSTITVVVPREPARVGIDPYRRLIDRNGDDNVAGAGSKPKRRRFS